MSASKIEKIIQRTPIRLPPVSWRVWYQNRCQSLTESLPMKPALLREKLRCEPYKNSNTGVLEAQDLSALALRSIRNRSSSEWSINSKQKQFIVICSNCCTKNICKKKTCDNDIRICFKSCPKGREMKSWKIPSQSFWRGLNISKTSHFMFVFVDEYYLYLEIRT